MTGSQGQIQAKRLSKRDALKRLLTQEIESGRFPDGRLPSIRSLAVEHNVSLVTANQALAGLAEDGLVQRHVGRGTFINSDVKVEPSPLAQGRQLVMMVDSSHREGYTDMIMVRAFSSHAMSNGFVPVVVSVDMSNPVDTIQSLQRAAGGGGIEGLLVTCSWDSMPEKLAENLLGSLPCVFMGKAPNGKCAVVEVDMASGVFQAVSHLHSLSHKRIVLLADSTWDPEPLFEKAVGMVRAAAQDAGGDSMEIIPVYPDVAGSVDEPLRSVLADECPPTAIICLAWTLLPPVRDLLHRLGLSVPDDVSLIGYGQNAEHLNLTPPLTCIEASKEHEIVAAINLLTEMLPNKERYHPKVSFPTWLIARGSTSIARPSGQ